MMNLRTKHEMRKIQMLIYGLAILGLFASGLYAQTTATIRANSVWCGIIENGGTGSFNYGGGWFPADYNCMGPSMEEGNAMTGSRVVTAALNWVDPDGATQAKGVTRTGDSYVVSVTSPLENYVRWSFPSSIVDFDDVTLDNFGEENPGELVGTSDQTARATYVNAMGIEVQRTVFAWSQQFHKDYIVVDLVLTNTSGTTLDDFYVQIGVGPNYWRKAKGGDPSIPAGDRVGVSRGACWHHYYGGRPGDSLRVHYMYHADDIGTAGDQMGAPVASQDGRLTESDILFYGILHASAVPYTNPANDVDDPLQPRVTDVYAPPAQGTEALWGNKTNRDPIYDLIAGKHGMEQPMPGQNAGTFHRANNDEQNDPDWSNLGEGLNKAAIWNRSWSSFGPYTFNDGESIHIVYASGYTGIGIEKEKEVGEKWKAGTLDEAPGLPNATTGYFPAEFAFPTDATDMDKVKDRWISTGIDTVHKTVSRAKWNFENNWQVPGAPPPPKMELTGTGQGVEIKWSCLEAEADPDFAGYRIMRRVGQRDTTFFDVIYESDETDLAAEHTYVDDDEEVTFGATYFYYVQSAVRIASNDANAYPGNRGKKIYSSRLWTPTHVDVTPKRPAGTELSQIRIVPNPYNIKDDLLEGYQFLSERQGIQFYNLPPVVKIVIFTESGDIVRTINHEPLTGDGLYVWDMLTDNQRVVASGVYIAVFETPSGEIAYQKFIVVR